MLRAMKIQRKIAWTVDQLREFEVNVSKEFESAKIHGPVHLSYGNEDYLIDLFQYIDSQDWVFSTWRNHYHALLHGVSREELMKKIMEGRSISFQSPEHHFYTSAIVNGILPIAVGTALGIKWKNDANFESYESMNTPGHLGLKCKICDYKGVLPDLVKSNHEHYDKRMVWCFIGDMAAESGAFYEALKYSILNELPIHFVIEDNNLSTNTPTDKAWGGKPACASFFNGGFSKYVSYYTYKRDVYPHVGIGRWITF